MAAKISQWEETACWRKTLSINGGAIRKNIDDTKEVLRLYGNMSSATVLYVLERFMDGDRQQGEKGLMLSFGPGFSAQRILLQW